MASKHHILTDMSEEDLSVFMANLVDVVEERRDACGFVASPGRHDGNAGEHAKSGNMAEASLKGSRTRTIAKNKRRHSEDAWRSMNSKMSNHGRSVVLKSPLSSKHAGRSFPAAGRSFYKEEGVVQGASLEAEEHRWAESLHSCDSSQDDDETNADGHLHGKSCRRDTTHVEDSVSGSNVESWIEETLVDVKVVDLVSSTNMHGTEVTFESDDEDEREDSPKFPKEASVSGQGTAVIGEDDELQLMLYSMSSPSALMTAISRKVSQMRLALYVSVFCFPFMALLMYFFYARWMESVRQGKWTVSQMSIETRLGWESAWAVFLGTALFLGVIVVSGPTLLFNLVVPRGVTASVLANRYKGLHMLMVIPPMLVTLFPTLFGFATVPAWVVVSGMVAMASLATLPVYILWHTVFGSTGVPFAVSILCVSSGIVGCLVYLYILPLLWSIFHDDSTRMVILVATTLTVDQWLGSLVRWICRRWISMGMHNEDHILHATLLLYHLSMRMMIYMLPTVMEQAAIGLTVSLVALGTQSLSRRVDSLVWTKVCGSVEAVKINAGSDADTWDRYGRAAESSRMVAILATGAVAAMGGLGGMGTGLLLGSMVAQYALEMGVQTGFALMCAHLGFKYAQMWNPSEDLQEAMRDTAARKKGCVVMESSESINRVKGVSKKLTNNYVLETESDDSSWSKNEGSKRSSTEDFDVEQGCLPVSITAKQRQSALLPFAHLFASHVRLYSDWTDPPTSATAAMVGTSLGVMLFWFGTFFCGNFGNVALPNQGLELGLLPLVLG